MPLIEKIKELIAKDKTDYVFSELMHIDLDEDKKNAILLLYSQWNIAKREYNIGIVSESEWSRKKSQINYSLLLLSDLIKNNNNTNKSIGNKIHKISKSNTINISGQGNLGVQNANNAKIIISHGKSTKTVKFKLLVINSLPKEKQALRIHEEIRIIEEALNTSSFRDQVEIIVKNAVQFDEVLKIIHSSRPDFVHFSLHLSKEKGLIFEDNSGNSQYVDKASFSDIFKLISGKNKVQLVLINACNSYEYALDISKFIDYAIGMKDFIPDDATLAFTKGFYEMLFEGEDIEFAFNAGLIALRLSKIEFNSANPLDEIPDLIKKNTA